MQVGGHEQDDRDRARHEKQDLPLQSESQLHALEPIARVQASEQQGHSNRNGHR